MSLQEKTIEVIKISNDLINYVLYANSVDNEELLTDITEMLGTDFREKLETLSLKHIDVEFISKAKDVIDEHFQHIIDNKDAITEIQEEL